MQVKKVIENENGVVSFDGELSPDEVDFVIGVGLNTLLKMGAFPLIKKQEEQKLND